jgi:hypothetical protein
METATTAAPMANGLCIEVVEWMSKRAAEVASPYGVGFDATPRGSTTNPIGGQPITVLSDLARDAPR